MLLVNDVVTLGWLFQSEAQTQRYVRFNCLRGGTYWPQCEEHQPLERLLAAISAIICKIKIEDNVKDEQSLSARGAQWFYSDTGKKAQIELQKLGFENDLILASLQRHTEIEERNEADLILAAEPTGTCYGLFCQNLAQMLKHPYQKDVSFEFGKGIGQLVYLLDAWRDRSSDSINDYNPFLCSGGLRTGIVQKSQINQFPALFDSLINQLSQLAVSFGEGFIQKWESVRNMLVQEAENSRGSNLIYFSRSHHHYHYDGDKASNQCYCCACLLICGCIRACENR
jgi:hypothetical protein